MRKTCLDMIHRLALTDSRVVYVGSDPSAGTLKQMAKDVPDRFIIEGIAEANLIGMAAGMAMDGLMPFVHTIATFLTRRCYEQVAIDVCLHDLPVRLVGNGGGLVYAPLGPTHTAIDDLALFSALPGMAVVACSDADEMVRLMQASLSWPGPLYIRLGKGGDPVISKEENGFAIGRAIPMRKGSDVLLVSTGVMTGRALAAAEILEADGIGCAVLHAHTVKPFDGEQTVALAQGKRLVVSVEEHSRIGGLGAAVLDALAASGPVPPTLRLALPDSFVHQYGSQDALLERFGLQPEGIAASITQAIRKR
ncbi:transketolase family protein [Magnetospirillum moscoviense]|uniref:Transketolase n=1 Tax=Magnetospirillum moscoviense TaxID=1437059 RepID=A0A178M9H5_9PROT|nr:transketolase C-terminal domain-containing protein [Magnetospirillum moscoviense]OAN45392.1 transketolase [Magnetospirillum moscoviense]